MTHEPCQVCGSISIDDYVKHEEGHYLRCRSCRLIFNADADELIAKAGEHYDDASYFVGYESRLLKKLRSARRRIDLVRSFVPGGRFLDIGCGVGDTLIAAREAGFDAVGLDVGQYPVQHCGELGFEVHRSSITDICLPDESFDVVTMWDVIEHIPRTAEGLREVSRVLKPGGVAVMITPTGDYVKAHLLRNTYQNYRGEWAQTHLVYHNRRTLTEVLRQCGLQPRRLPVIRTGTFRRGWSQAAAEALLGVPRELFRSVRSACRLTRNLLVVAGKPQDARESQPGI